MDGDFRVLRGMNLERNYNFDIGVPKQHYDAFLNSIIIGEICKVMTEYNNVLLCAFPKSGSMHLWE